MNLLKSRIIQGTLLLTVAGFVTRILGFFYRIFLADKLGAAVLGSYQLIFPVFAICASIYGAGVQTAISQLIAAEQGKRAKPSAANSPAVKSQSSSPNSVEQNCRAILFLGCILSVLLAGILTFGVYTKADWIAARFIMAPECAPYLQIMCVLFPFCGIGACINGYYYGIQNATVPSMTQIIEQISRLAFVFILLIVFPGSAEQNCIIAVWGIVVGEVVSALYNMYKYMQQPKKDKANALSSFRHGLRHYSLPLLSLSTSLTGTKLIIALLHSAESVFIAAALRQYGCSTKEALSIYGILSGMVMPFILFPSSITNAIALMLLPAVATSSSDGDHAKVHRYFATSNKYSLLLGAACTAFFLIFGDFLGTFCFHNQTAGEFLRLLSLLCPFLYLSTTLTSIINGLGRTKETFLITCVSQSIKLFCLVALVPHFGIMAYIYGTILSQAFMALLCYLTAKHLIA